MADNSSSYGANTARGIVGTPNASGGYNYSIPDKSKPVDKPITIITPISSSGQRGTSIVYDTSNPNNPQPIMEGTLTESSSVSQPIYTNAANQPISIAPSIAIQQNALAQNNGTIFDVGYGLQSINPYSVPTNKDLGYGFKQSYGGTPIQTGSTSVYNLEVPSQSLLFNVPTKPESKPFFIDVLDRAKPSDNMVVNSQLLSDSTLNYFNQKVEYQREDWINAKNTMGLKAFPVGGLMVLQMGVNTIGAPYKTAKNMVSNTGMFVYGMGSAIVFDVTHLQSSRYPFEETSNKVKGVAIQAYNDPIGTAVQFYLFDTAFKPVTSWGKLGINSAKNKLFEKGILETPNFEFTDLFRGTKTISGEDVFVKNPDLKGVVDISFGGGTYNQIKFVDAFTDTTKSNGELNGLTFKPFVSTVHVSPGSVPFDSMGRLLLTRQAESPNVIPPVVNSRTINFGFGDLTIKSVSDTAAPAEGINALRLQNDLTNFYVAPDAISPKLDLLGFNGREPVYNVVSPGQAQAYTAYAFGTQSLDYRLTFFKGSPSANFGVSGVGKTTIINGDLFDTSMFLNYGSPKGGIVYVSPENIRGLGFSNEFQMVQIADKSFINMKSNMLDSLRTSNGWEPISSPNRFTFVKVTTTNPYDLAIENLNKPKINVIGYTPDFKPITQEVYMNPISKGISKGFLSIPKAYLDATMPKFAIEKLAIKEVYYTEAPYVTRLTNGLKSDIGKMPEGRLQSFSMGGADPLRSSSSKGYKVYGISDYALKSVSLSASKSLSYPSSFKSSSISSSLALNSFPLSSSKSFSSSSLSSKSSSLSSSSLSFSSSLSSSSKSSSSKSLSSSFSSSLSSSLSSSVSSSKSSSLNSSSSRSSRSSSSSSRYNPFVQPPPPFGGGSSNEGNVIKPFKKLKKSRSKVGYFPSIEASLFDIHSTGKVNLKQAYSGLTLRPIRGG